MNPIRIAFAAPDAAAERWPFLVDHVNALRQHGDVVELVSTGQARLVDRGVVAGRRLASALRADPRQTVAAAGAIARGGGSPARFKDLSMVAGVLAARSDVVHFSFSYLAHHGTAILSDPDLPTVVTCNGSEARLEPLLGREARTRIADLLAGADLVHCVSAELAGHATALGVPADRIHVAPWGVDTRFFTPGRAPNGSQQDGPLRLVCIGRLHWVKGFAYALDAVARLRRRGIDARLAVLGTDHDPSGALEVLSAVEHYDLHDAVELRGHATRQEVRAALRASDIFVLSSLSEGINIATLEAMAVGLPVVVTDVGGMREAVTDGVEGFLVPARDAVALEERLASLAADPLRRCELGRNGRMRVEREFDVLHLAGEFRTQYRRLLS